MLQLALRKCALLCKLTGLFCKGNPCIGGSLHILHCLSARMRELSHLLDDERAFLHPVLLQG